MAVTTPARGRLRRADCSATGIHRRRRGSGFSFADAGGTPITDEETLGRIRDLAIPPAWKDVWICPDPLGHIQATGYDEAGRKQYRYHDRWDRRRASRKYAAMREFAAALPRLRRRVSHDIGLEGMPRERALATAIRLLDLGFFRVGGEEYAAENGSYGLATIRRDHVHREGEEIVFDFPAKSSRRRIQAIGDKEAIAALETMRRRRGGPPDLLAWRDGRRWRDVRSVDINAYIQETIGERFTAKDFRTWSGTVLAAAALAGEEKPASEAAAKRTVAGAVKTVAAALGNTPAVCRRSYIDPRVIDRYRDGETIDRGRRAAAAGRMSQRTRRKVEREVLDLID
ncbi:MAG TPA: DNA topoisomerase IB [Solirubrobacterales bacterium]|nr:DNA topoisomerase IB [Solirubrobacterales bacterium]